MLFTPPRLCNVLLGIFFLAINTGIYVLSYYTVMRPLDDPAAQHITFLFVLYGCSQNFVGVIGGLLLARITEVETEEKMTTPIDADEEEMMLIADSLPA